MSRVRSDFKKCTKCKRWLWKSKFSVDRWTKDGLNCWCYECRNEYLRKWKIENREKINEQNRKYRMENPEKNNERQRKYRIENRDVIHEYLRKYYIENREKFCEQQRKRRIENPEKTAAVKFVRSSIKKNGFPPPIMCVVCSSIENVQYHHESYERNHWLSVVPVCVRCHRRLHAFYKAKEKNQTPVKGDEQIIQIVHEEFLSLYRREKECV